MAGQQDIVFRTVIDDSNFDQALASMGQGVQGVEEKMEELSQATTEAFTEMKEAGEEVENGMTAVGDATARAGEAAEKQGKQVKDSAGETKKFSETAKNAAKNVNILGVNLGDVIERLQAKRKALQGVIKGMKGTVTVTKLLKAALVSSGIGAIVVVLGSLVAWLTKTQEGLSFVRKATAAVSAGFSVIVDRASSFAKVLKNVALFRFGKAAKEAKEALKGMGDEMVREIALAQQLEQVLIDVEEAEASLNIRRSATRTRLKELNLLIEDRTKSTKDRLAAAEEFADIEKGLVAEEVANQEKRVAAMLGFAEVTDEVRATIQQIGQEGVSLDQLGLSKSTIKDAEEFAGEIGKLFELQTRSFELQTTNNNKLNTILQEAAAKRQAILKAEQERIQKLKDEYSSLIERFEEQVQAADLALTDNLVERLEKRRDIALGELDEFILQTRKKAEALGAELPADFETNVQLLRDAIFKEFRTGLQDLENQRGELIEPIAGLVTPDPNDVFLNTAGGEIAKRLSQGIQDGMEQPEVGLVFDNLKGNLLEAFQLDEAQAGLIIDQFSMIFYSIQELSAEATQAQLDQQDQLIQASADRISELEKDLQREKALQDRGLANDVARVERAIEQERQLKQKQEAQRLAIEKKAARQRLIIESLQQASNIALAVTKVISSEASKGLIGIITATAALSLLFGIVANAKSKAANISAAPKLKKGGRLEGPGHEAGGVPVWVTDGPLYEAEGGEWMINKKASREHDTFLADLNEGKYKGVDLQGLFHQAMDFDVAGIMAGKAEVIRLEDERTFALVAASISEAISQNTDRMISHWKERPVDTPLDRPIKREFVKGTTKVVEVIRPQNLEH